MKKQNDDCGDFKELVSYRIQKSHRLLKSASQQQNKIFRQILGRIIFSVESIVI